MEGTVNTETDTETVRLSWGLPVPANAPAAWGARAILNPGAPKPVDLLPDRQDSRGARDKLDILNTILNRAGGLDIVQARVRGLVVTSKLSSREAEEFVLLDTDLIRVIGNTNASHGYLYLSAWLKPEALDTSEATWSGQDAPPEPGSRVRTRVHKQGAEDVKVLTSINLHGHHFVVFLASDAKVDGRDLRELREGRRYLDTPHHPYPALGLTVGHELR